jgi:hypothetical protein
MRTDEEILARVAAVAGDDFLGTTRGELLCRLPFEVAKPVLKADATDDGWKVLPREREAILKEMHGYADFAWGKVRDHRAISAGRSLDHYRGWIWLLGDDEVLAAMESIDYPNYGAPQLAFICRHYGIPIPEGDDLKRMSEGDTCKPGCDYGCGR